MRVGCVRDEGNVPRTHDTKQAAKAAKAVAGVAAVAGTVSVRIQVALYVVREAQAAIGYSTDRMQKDYCLTVCLFVNGEGLPPKPQRCLHADGRA